MILTRVNAMGLRFQLHAEGDKTVAVYTGSRPVKTVVLDMTLDEVNQAWFKWQNGEYIQVAFKKLPPEQREFLMTAITPREWKKTFSEEEE